MTTQRKEPNRCATPGCNRWTQTSRALHCSKCVKFEYTLDGDSMVFVEKDKAVMRDWNAQVMRTRALMSAGGETVRNVARWWR